MLISSHFSLAELFGAYHIHALILLELIFKFDWSNGCGASIVLLLFLLLFLSEYLSMKTTIISLLSYLML